MRPGLNRPQALHGSSLLPLLEDGTATRRDVLIEFNRYEIEHDSFGGFIPMRALVTDDFKLVVNLFDTDELYDRAQRSGRDAEPHRPTGLRGGSR